MTTDPETPTARALLSKAFVEAHRGNAGYIWFDDIERTPSGAELLHRADEARVAGGLSEQEWPEPCCYLNHEVDEPCGLPPVKVVFTQTMDSIPAPRPPEPDRTAALVEAAKRYVWDTEHKYPTTQMARDYHDLRDAVHALATPDPASVADGTCRFTLDGWTCLRPASDPNHEDRFEHGTMASHPFTPTPPTDGAA